MYQGASTVIQDLFGGQYVSQLKASGAPQSDTMQPFTLLTLDILSDSVSTLSDAISNFTATNTLEGGDSRSQQTVNQGVQAIVTYPLQGACAELNLGNGLQTLKPSFPSIMRQCTLHLCTEQYLFSTFAFIQLCIVGFVMRSRSWYLSARNGQVLGTILSLTEQISLGHHPER